MLRRPRRRLAAVSTACAVFWLAATAAAAQAAMTLSVGTPTLTGRVNVTVPVTVSCDPFDPTLFYAYDQVNVTVEQAAGKEIAHGTGSAGGVAPSLLFACDSAPHTASVGVLADPTGPPFHGGQAAVTANAFAQAGTSCGNGCIYNIVAQSAGAGPTTMRLH